MKHLGLVPTGVPHLDRILGGGIVPHALFLILGGSGTGKTVLVSQIAFAAAARDERVLFITAYAEPHSKLITNLQTLRFYRPDDVGERIKLLNLQYPLASGTDAAADMIVREAREHHATLVIIDGFQGIRLTSQAPAAPHQFLYDLSSKMSLLGTTLIVTYDLGSLSEAEIGELSAADGVLELAQEVHGEQTTRHLRVIKHRGTQPLLGRHSFVLDDRGLTCYPLLEALVSAQDMPLMPVRAGFGIPALDVMLGGGCTLGSATIAAGAYGVGKTLLGLHFVMEGMARGEHALFVTFHETPQQLAAKGAMFGLPIQAALDDGRLIIRHYLATNLNADLLAQEIGALLAEQPIRRLVIDGLNEIERPLIERRRAHSFFAALIALLRNHGVTSYITQEIDPIVGRELSFAAKNLTALADNLLLLQHRLVPNRSTHLLTVLKMRFSNHERLPHPFTIGERGIDVSPTPLVDVAGQE